MKAADCRDELLLAYLEGELDSRQHRDVEEHLSRCSSCRQQLAGLAATLRCVDQGPVPHRNPLYVRGLLYRVRRGIRARQDRTRRRRWGLSLAGAAGLLSTLALVFWTRSGHDLPAALTAGVVPRSSQVAWLGDGEQIAELIETYLVQTASTEELLAAIGDLDVDDELLAFSEDE